jgi:hypothetical protein
LLKKFSLSSESQYVLAIATQLSSGDQGEIFKDKCQTSFGITDTGYVSKKNPLSNDKGLKVGELLF